MHQSVWCGSRGGVVEEWLHHLWAMLKPWLFLFQCNNRRRDASIAAASSDFNRDSVCSWQKLQHGRPRWEHNDWVLFRTPLRRSKSPVGFSRHENIHDSAPFQSGPWAHPLCWGVVVWASWRRWLNRKQRIVVVLRAINDLFIFPWSIMQLYTDKQPASSSACHPLSLHSVCLTGWWKLRTEAGPSTPQRSMENFTESVVWRTVYITFRSNQVMQHVTNRIPVILLDSAASSDLNRLIEFNKGGKNS